MHLDNQKLKAIKVQKEELRKQIKDCYSIEKLLWLDEKYKELCNTEIEILSHLEDDVVDT